MPKVDREHEPRTWSSWAITRDDFAKLVDDVDRILTEETDGPTEVEISVPGYERDFTGREEFLENVSETDWLDASSVTLRAASGQFVEEGRLRVRLQIYTFSDVELSLNGRTRRSRNAVEPDLVAAIGRYARRPHGFFRSFALVMGPAYLLASAILVGLAVALDELEAGFVIAIGAATAAFTFVWGIAVRRAKPTVRRAAQPVELLRDDGISAWDDLRKRRLRQARVAGSVIVGIATVAAVIVSIAKD